MPLLRGTHRGLSSALLVGCVFGGLPSGVIFDPGGWVPDKGATVRSVGKIW